MRCRPRPGGRFSGRPLDRMMRVEARTNEIRKLGGGSTNHRRPARAGSANEGGVGGSPAGSGRVAACPGGGRPTRASAARAGQPRPPLTEGVQLPGVSADPQKVRTRGPNPALFISTWRMCWTRLARAFRHKWRGNSIPIGSSPLTVEDTHDFNTLRHEMDEMDEGVTTRGVSGGGPEFHERTHPHPHGSLRSRGARSHRARDRRDGGADRRQVQVRFRCRHASNGTPFCAVRTSTANRASSSRFGRTSA